MVSDLDLMLNANACRKASVDSWNVAIASRRSNRCVCSNIVSERFWPGIFLIRKRNQSFVLSWTSGRKRPTFDFQKLGFMKPLFRTSAKRFSKKFFHLYFSRCSPPFKASSQKILGEVRERHEKVSWTDLRRRCWKSSPQIIFLTKSRIESLKWDQLNLWTSSWDKRWIVAWNSHCSVGFSV